MKNVHNIAMGERYIITCYRIPIGLIDALPENKILHTDTDIITYTFSEILENEYLKDILLATLRKFGNFLFGINLALDEMNMSQTLFELHQLLEQARLIQATQ